MNSKKNILKQNMPQYRKCPDGSEITSSNPCKVRLRAEGDRKRMLIGKNIDAFELVITSIKKITTCAVILRFSYFS